jgi:hypothetical protein
MNVKLTCVKGMARIQKARGLELAIAEVEHTIECDEASLDAFNAHSNNLSVAAQKRKEYTIAWLNNERTRLKQLRAALAEINQL